MTITQLILIIYLKTYLILSLLFAADGYTQFNKYKSKTKYKSSINILKKARKLTKIPIVAIGGINFKNYKKLLLNKANLLAISGYIWKNRKLKPFEAIKKFK